MTQEFDIIPFQLFNLNLQEPMSFVTNWLIAFFCLYAFGSLKYGKNTFVDRWKNFYLILTISSLLAGLGHLLFQYFDIYGKMPSWVLGAVAGIFASLGMLSIWHNKKSKSFLTYVVFIKSIVLVSSALYLKSFLFIAIDAILTYLLFCGFMGLLLHRKKYAGMKYIVIGVLVLIPSAFIFLLKVNLHRFLNRDDLSHLLMLFCVILFYKGVRKVFLLDVHPS
ncbi:MAG: hypothetical protein ACI9G9_001175 [Psychromonas sp.]|jgi:hypothetical protein